MAKEYICGSDRFFYGMGYLALSLDSFDLPDSLLIEGQKLQKKSSLHVSLLCVKNLPNFGTKLENKVLDLFCKLVQKSDISFVRYTGEFRYAQHEDKKSLIARCEVSNLDPFFEELEKELSIEIPRQPTHVTFYTLQPEIGIGLNSQAEMNEKSVVTDPPEEVKAALGLA